MMKRRISPSSRIALISAGSLILLCSLFVLIFSLAAAQADPQDGAVHLQNSLEEARNGTSLLLKGSKNGEFFAANYFPTLNGAKGDRITDDTKALKEILALAEETGGTVYLPQGVYRISEPLIVPGNVTLRGDFASPDSKGPTAGATILLVQDTESTRGEPLLTLRDGAAAEGITVYYESQDPNQIIEYPATVYCSGSAVLRNFALLNAYHGICLTGSGKVTVQSGWISALDYGLLITENDSAVTVEDLSVSPAYWLNYASSVFTDGAGYEELTQYLKGNMHALILEKTADMILNRIKIEDAGVGILFNVPKERDSILLASELQISTTVYPLEIQSLPAAGICFEDCSFRPDSDSGSHTVEIGAGTQAPILFSACTFAGLPKTVIHAENESFLSFYHCNFGTWWNVCFDMKGDTFLAVSPVFKTKNEKAALGQNALGLFYNAEAIAESSKLLFSIPAPDAKATGSTPVKALKASPKTTGTGGVIYASDFGVSTNSADNSEALKTALEKAAETKSTVFLPEGTYTFRSIVTIPDSVRLIGAGNRGAYRTVLSFDLQKDTDFSLVEMMPGSGVEALEVHQSSVPAESVKTYAISSMFTDISVRNVTVSAVRGIWLASAKNAVLEQIDAQISKVGIYLQETENVTLRNIEIIAPAGIPGSIGLKAEGSEAEISGLRGEYLSCALETSGKVRLTGTVLNLRKCSVGVRTAHEGELTLTSVGASHPGGGENSRLLETTETMKGSVVLEGFLCGGETRMGNLASIRNGTADLRAGIATAPMNTVIRNENDGETAVTGCIFAFAPALHAEVSDGTVTFTANLLKSDKTFEGIDADYLLTSVAEAGKVENDYNVIQHIYVESDEGLESGGNNAETKPY